MFIDPRYARLMTPGGTRDFLPPEAARKIALERRLRDVFRLWGYGPVMTPTVEHLETVVQSNGHETADKLYRLFDREGHTLALRPEVTTAIARIAATRLKDEPKPVRLHYVANVFRHEPLKAGRQREFWQAGVELVGASGPAADAEMIALAVEALLRSGLVRFRVEIGHVGYFNGLVESLGVPERHRRALRRALLQRDYVGFEAALDAVRPPGLPGDGGPGDGTEASAACDTVRSWRGLQRMPRLRGGRDVIAEALDVADNDQSRAAAKDVAAICDELAAHGVLDHVHVDFGMIKDLDYYTGMVLEGYADGIGFPVCTGGRYDNLIGRFGDDAPATGFVLGVERVLAALDAQGQGGPDGGADVGTDRLIVYEPGARIRALAGARALREQGLVVETDVNGWSVEVAVDYARRRGIHEVVFVPAEGPAERRPGPDYRPVKAVDWP